LFLKKGVNVLEKQSQRNMGKFMKILLVKRLESSFHAFKQSIDRFIKSYKMFIKQYENGKVYISKKYSSKIFEILEKEDDKTLELLGELVEAGKAKEFNSYNFTSAFIEDLENDLKVLNDIQKLWKKVNRDPKIEKLKKEMRENPILKKNHVLIFTESKETAVYLSKNLNEEKTMLFTGDSKESEREELIANFDANSSHKKNEYRILISTEVLSEGVNLHRGNVVINYDIPWNPTRMMQRVGRINRVDTPHEKIYTFNFFPTSQSNEQIKLEEAAKGKINAFFTLLGGDAELLTEGEPIDSHELFDRLTSKTILEEEEENSELKYLKIIKDIRENNAELFEKIKKLPKKARTGKESELVKDSLITFFRKGKIKKFFIADEKSKELDFISAADLLKCNEQTNREKIPKEYYQLLKDNKLNFDYYTAEEVIGTTSARRNSNASKVIGYLRVQDTKKMTEEQEEYIQTIIKKIEEGNIPNRTIKNVKEALEKLGEELSNSLKVIGVLKSKIPEEILQEHYSDSRGNSNYQREIILSMFLTGGKNE
jgi:superfamily II DNA/RNA helicase